MFFDHPIAASFKSLPEALRRVGDTDQYIVFILLDGTEQRVSYKTLLTEARRFAEVAAAQGARAGDPILLQFLDLRCFVTAFWGSILAGFVPVPVHFGPRDDHVQKTRNVWNVLEGGFLATEAKPLETLRQGWGADVPFVAQEAIILCDPQDRAFCAQEAPTLDWAAIPDPDPQSIAYLQFSSGSTGAPKGVEITHKMTLLCALAMAEQLPYPKGHVAHNWAPLTHDMGLVLGHITPLVLGVSQIQMDTAVFVRRPLSWLDTACKYGATNLLGSNSSLNYFLEAFRRSKRSFDWDLSALTWWGLGAEPIDPRLVRKLLEALAPYGLRSAVMTPGYGMAETVLATAIKPMHSDWRGVAVDRRHVTLGEAIRPPQSDMYRAEFMSNGPPLRGVEIRIADEAGAPLPEGHVGRILQRGGCVMERYYRNPEITAEVLSSQGWFDTGDLGFFHDGELVPTGRAKEIIIVGGLNLYPQDLETIASTCDGVEEGNVAAVAIPSTIGPSEKIALFVRTKLKGAAFEQFAESLRHHMSTHAGVAIEQVHAVRRMPKTTSGKIKRVALAAELEPIDVAPATLKAQSAPETARKEVQDEREGSAPRAVSEAALEDDPGLRDALQKLLLDAVTPWVSTDQVDLEKALADQGMNSIGAVDVTMTVEDALGLELSGSLVFDYPNIAGLVGYLSERVMQDPAAAAYRATVLPDALPDALPEALPDAPPAPAPDDVAVSQRASAANGPRAPDRGDAAKVTEPRERPALRGPAVEPIAIIGVGLRLPGGVDSRAVLWEMLLEGREAIGPIPPSRWDRAQYYHPDRNRPGHMAIQEGGFLSGIDQFDAGFFGIAPDEAERMDPQHRLLLETSWEAFEDAGIAADRLKGSATGVFMGVCSGDYGRRTLFSTDPRRADAHALTGNTQSIAAGRIAYCFGLQGPTLALDTACSSGMVALHLACDSLRKGESHLALAGGVSLYLAPQAHIAFSQLGAMAPDGRCKTFDAKADGYTRSEGCIVLTLKRLSDAKADGDRVLSVIRGSAVNQDGASNGLTAPSGQAQQAVIRTAQQTAAVHPDEISYVEAHGTGTPLGDVQEVTALAQVFTPRATPDKLRVGSIKTNIGHTEAVAGLAGIVKTALMLREATWVASLNVRRLNPGIAWQEVPVCVQQTAQPWPEGREGQPRLAGVSSFGFSGTNAHVILEAPPQPAQVRAASTGPYVLPISARSATAASALATQLADYIETHAPDLTAVASTLAHRRSHLPYRALVAGQSASDVLRALRAAQPSGRAAPAQPRRTVFVFPGQGAQWRGMAMDLLETEPTFAQRFGSLVDPIRAESGFDISHLLARYAEGEDLSIDQMQPLLFALSVSLVAVWAARGVQPDIVIGHSMGEVAAANVVGMLSDRDAAAVICRRSKLMQRLAGTGAMAVVDLSAAETADLIAPEAEAVSIAVCNAPGSTVISGRRGAIDRVLAELERRAVFARKVAVDVASHSPEVDALREDLLAALADICPQEGTGVMLSSVGTRCEGKPLDGRALDAAYWVENLRAPVRFDKAIEAAIAMGAGQVVEISPHPILVPVLADRTGGDGRALCATGTLIRDTSAQEALTTSLEALYQAGAAIDWTRLADRHTPPVDLPFYPWQKERFWIEDRAPASGARAVSAPDGRALIWHGTLDPKAESWLLDHRVQGEVVLPGAYMVSLMQEAVASHLNQQGGAQDAGSDAAPADALRDVAFRKLCALGTHSLPFCVQISGDKVALYVPRQDVSEEGAPVDDWRCLATARRIMPGQTIKRADVPAMPHTTVLSGAQFYDKLTRRGYGYGRSFQGVETLERSQNHVSARVALPAHLAADPAYASRLHPALLDICLQPILACQNGCAVPTRIDAIKQEALPDPSLGSELRVEGQRAEDGTWSLQVEQIDGGAVLSVTGLRFARLDRHETAVSPLLYETSWQPFPVSPQNGEAQTQGETSESETQDSAQEIPLGAERIGLIAANGALATHLEALGALRTDMTEADGFDRLVLVLELPQISAEDLSAQTVYQRLAALVGELAPMVQEASGPALNIVIVAPAGAPMAQAVTALVRSFAAEAPARSVTALLMEPVADPASMDLRPLCAAWTDTAETIRLVQTPLEGEARMELQVLRARALSPVVTDRAAQQRAIAARIGRVGQPETIHFVPRDLPRPQPHEVVVEIAATGLNFLNALSAYGRYPGAPEGFRALGLEGAGRIVAVGADVKDLRVGDLVTGMMEGALGSHGVAHASLVARVPQNGALDLCAAASLPVALLTADCALVDLGRIAPGDVVLIHAASGGVGQILVQQALSLGAVVLATAGSQEKRDMVKALGAQAVFDSRSDAFVAQVRAATQGRGVDCVINSLAGPLMIASLGLLAPMGRFVEIGKRDIYEGTALPLDQLRFGASYLTLDLDLMARTMPQALGARLPALLETVAQGVQEGTVQLPRLDLRPWSAAAQALTDMVAGQHLGKLVLDHGEGAPPLRQGQGLRVDPNAAYVISGGTGAVGRALADGLVAKGARHLVLLARSAPSAETVRAISHWRSLGARVDLPRVDVADADDIAAVMERLEETGVPLKGIIHAAGVLEDATFATLDSAALRRVLRPKVEGALTLHALTLDAPLDFFVMLSSAAALAGPIGQSAYAAANGFLDGLAQERSAAGLPGMSLALGPVAEAGLAVAGADRQQAINDAGWQWLDPDALPEILDRALQSGHSYVLAADLSGSVPDTPVFSMLEQAARAPVAADVLTEYHAQQGAARRLAWLEAHLCTEIAALVRRVPEQIDPVAAFRDMGLDSMLAIRLRNRLTETLGETVPVSSFWTYPTVSDYARFLTDRLRDRPAVQSESKS